MCRESRVASSVRRLSAPGVVGLVVLLSSPLSAASDDYWEGNAEAPSTTRRSGFTMGVTAGLYAGRARGFPNEVEQIGQDAFLTNTRFGAGGGGVLWLGGALTDWFSFGLGASSGGFGGTDGLVGSGGAFLIRVETFPLFYRGGAWQDLGVVLSAGTGSFVVEDGDETVAEGAGTSVVGLGAFYEPFRWWQFSSGPSLEYSHQFVSSLDVHAVLLGWRAVFYGGP